MRVTGTSRLQSCCRSESELSCCPGGLSGVDGGLKRERERERERRGRDRVRVAHGGAWSQRLFTASASTTDVTAQLHICGLVRLLPTAMLVEDGSVSATLEPSLVGYTTVTRTNTYPWSSQLPRRYAALLSWRTALGVVDAGPRLCSLW